MKYVMPCLAMICAVLTFKAHCEEPGKDSKANALGGGAYAKSQMTEKERAERREQILRVTGGMVVKPGSQQGRIAYVNAQSKIPSAMITDCVAQLVNQTRFNITIESGDAVTYSTALAARRKLGLDFAIFIVANDDIPTLLLAPEERWSIINVAPLTRDKKDIAFGAARLKKEMARAYVYLCGGVSSKYGHSLVGAISSPSDLDDIPDSRLPLDVVGRTVQFLPVCGVTRAVKAEYIQACEQGWAPQPTNEYQRAIWERYQQKPTKGIEIKYDPKVGK